MALLCFRRCNTLSDNVRRWGRFHELHCLFFGRQEAGSGAAGLADLSHSTGQFVGFSIWTIQVASSGFLIFQFSKKDRRGKNAFRSGRSYRLCVWGPRCAGAGYVLRSLQKDASILLLHNLTFTGSHSSVMRTRLLITGWAKVNL